MSRLKCQLLIIALLVGGLCATAAHAQEYTYTVIDNGTVFPADATDFSFTESTLATSGDATSITQISGASAADFGWNSTASASVSCSDGSASFGGDAAACIAYSGGAGTFESFTAGSFLAPGSYTSLAGDMTVTIQESQTIVPEPPSLELLGISLLVLTPVLWCKKRLA